MNIEHFDLLSSVHERPDASQNKKPCARRREAEHKAASASGDPAMVFGFRMASILSLRSRAPCPLRPAAGLLLDVRIGHDGFFFMPLCMMGFENRKTPVL